MSDIKDIKVSGKTNEDLGKEITHKINLLSKNEIVKAIKLRPGEQDIRQLPKKDMLQLNYRLQCDEWQYLAAINSTLVAVQIILMEIAKKQGIEIEKILDEVTKVDKN
jgi:hypothetical protein